MRFPTIWYVGLAKAQTSGYAQTDQNLCWSLKYSMTVKLLTDPHLRFLSLKEAAQARMSLHLSKCQIVGNLMLRLII